VNSKQFSTLAMIMILLVGCGTSLPDLAKIRAQMASEQLEVGDPITNSVGITLVPIPSGEFQMGTAVPKRKEKKKPQLPPGSDAEQPLHKVNISQPFYIGICEITQEQYEQVMQEAPWKDQPLTRDGANIAASYVSWEQANVFCKKLSEIENVTYRLPTEAEWEYACRAGTTTPFSFENLKQFQEYAWVDQNSYKNGEQYAHAAGRSCRMPGRYMTCTETFGNGVPTFMALMRNKSSLRKARR